jgi:predicted dehydrogenase
MRAGEPIGWGVLGGSARITRRGFLPGVAAARNGRLVAVGSRRPARDAAHRVGSYEGSYDDVLADPAVDAVYVALPNALHHEWVLAALAAGKHVLCEKPLTLTSVAAAEIGAAAAASGLVVMEAFMYRFHPQYERAAWDRLLAPVGALRAAEVHFSEPMDIPGDIRADPALGGGALWDLGCYCLDLVSGLFGEAGTVHATGAARHGCNWSCSARIRFAGGQLVTCRWSFSGPRGQRATLVGDRGAVTLHDPFRPGGATTAVLEADGVATTVEQPGDDCFRREIEHVGDVVSGVAAPALTPADSVRWLGLAERVERCLAAPEVVGAPGQGDRAR